MKTIRIQASGSYEVHIGSGTAAMLQQALADLVKGKNIAVISDKTVWELYGKGLSADLQNAGYAVSYMAFSPGESSKSIGSFAEILTLLAENGFRREDCILALGGGVTGDLAGFAAACYMRGIAYIQVPTSLLAMVDASVGGKTAVNINQELAKNICGAFHQPAAVFCDTDHLHTLPETHFREGCAEIIKYGILYDPELFAHLEEKGLDFDREWVISRCIQWKAAAVHADEFDTGARRLLNLGHTVGHAIEVESGYQVSHGEAVATGIAIVTRAAVQSGLCEPGAADRILSLLQKFGLPLYTEWSAENLWEIALSDKKAANGHIPVIVPETIGSCRIEPMEEDRLRSFIALGCRKDITVSPRRLCGTVDAPPSKSCAHRALICAAISPTPTQILCGPTGEDVTASVTCLRALGATITENKQGFSVEPMENIPKSATLFCGESGSTLRFLLPLAGALGINTLFCLEGRLSQRPLSPLWEEMERMGCRLRKNSNFINCSGKLRCGDYQIDAAVSSQFVSGLKMALPLLPGSTLTVTGRITSAPYIALTDAVMKKFPCESFCVEGDWSNAAFFFAANALGSEIQVNGLAEDSVQGDRAILDLLNTLDKHTVISAKDIPDLIPILAVVAACKQGAVFTDISRLRSKESDRVEGICQMLTSLGGQCQADENTLTVFPTPLIGGTVDAKNDHRIAMAAAIAATVCKDSVTILGADCVKKSYPQFWEHYRSLGGSLCAAYMKTI